MRDWSKLTVAKLKEELDRLGLPKTGLKAVLVQRLEEAEAQKESEEAAAAENVESHSPENAVEHGNDASAVQTSESSEPAQAIALQSNALEVSSEDKEHGQNKSKDIPVDARASVAEADDAEPAENSADTELLGDQSPLHPSVAVPSQPEILPGNLTQTGTREGTVEAQLPTPAPTQQEAFAGQTSTQTSVAPEELAEDSRKRKRRSKSPPPSSFETSKKLKQDAPVDERPDVRLAEDVQGSQVEEELDQNQGQMNGHLERDAGVEPTSPKLQDISKQTQEIEATGDVPPSQSEQKAGSRSPSPQRRKSDAATKASPADRRFKALTSPTTKPATSFSPADDHKPSDRSTTPSVHPATAGIYVRNLMRPLNPSQFKAHLTSLASSADKDSDDAAAPSITTFHVDPIRTHALVLFTDTASASRVRAKLHDRVWPNERDRKPLWIDFIPEEKVARWIEVETEQAGSGGAGTGRNNNKRWEVVYEETEQDGTPKVMAYLQEASSSSSAASASTGAAVGGGAGRDLAARVERQSQASHAQTAAPTTPSQPSGPPRAVTESLSKEFAALDDLFRSTTSAKPKLYFLPHDDESDVVARRLDILRREEDRGPPSSRGGDEMRRFSFLGGRVVDKGPEFGYGRGGGGRGRGGGGGGYRGRGGGGDGWRGRGGGDGWRGGGGGGMRRGDRAW